MCKGSGVGRGMLKYTKYTEEDMAACLAANAAVDVSGEDVGKEHEA